MSFQPLPFSLANKQQKTVSFQPLPFSLANKEQKTKSNAVSSKMNGVEDVSSIPEFKIRSLNGGTRFLRGGDYIWCLGKVMTLGVAYAMNGKKYGLTSAYPFTTYGLGVTVRAFNSDTASKQNPDGRMAHETVDIGKVVSIHRETDSAVFEIFPHVHIWERAVNFPGKGGDVVKIIDLPAPFTRSVEDHAIIEDQFFGPTFETLWMRGASERRVLATTFTPGNPTGSTPSFFAADDGGRIPCGYIAVDFEGDRGSLYLDRDDRPCYMHTGMHCTADSAILHARAARVQDIVDAHATFFGNSQLLDTSPAMVVPSSVDDHFRVNIRWGKLVNPAGWSGQYPIAPEREMVWMEGDMDGSLLPVAEPREGNYDPSKNPQV